ncbi:ABC transporter permease [Jingyaoa shaoxingensis]|uniref:ABC transporter permease n=1 Tax=Jingyaoa shaoxingensis TaxID=2763671 RepID=A0ABR7NCR5_9FIRM|nr:ABC transporter permease [Jingyaoa shaoxingensis]MBC8573508.1 ABC transporter permease [Jingyaoa shaoxingensis]
MAKYITKRLLMGLVSLFALITVTFFLTRLMPGNPFDISNVNQAVQDRIMSYYGLDQPVHVQFGMYLKNLSHGDLGISYKKVGTTVNQLIMQEAPYTIQIGMLAFIIALILGTIIGIAMAVTRKEGVRGSLMFLTVLGISIPNYVLALLLMLVCGVTLKWFPVVGLGSWKHYILPVTAMTVYPLAQISKLVKSSYSEAMHQDYVIMARAKGISKVRISFVHILKNAMIPVITISGPMVAFLLTGSFVVENIFTIPGIGREFVNSVSNRDYTVIMGLTIFLGIILVLCNLISDIICALVDPRIKLEK